MSHASPKEPQQAEFDGEELLGLLAEVDAELPAEAQVEIAAIGGGVLALRWEDRMTADLDVVSESMPPELRTAAARVAGRHNLRPDWINDAAKIKTPDLDPQLELLYAGDRLTVYGAGPRYLLASKLFAARAHDFDDALRLADETGITDAEDMLDLLSDAYPHRLLTPRIEHHARQVAEAAQAAASSGQDE